MPRHLVGLLRSAKKYVKRNQAAKPEVCETFSTVIANIEAMMKLIKSMTFNPLDTGFKGISSLIEQRRAFDINRMQITLGQLSHIILQVEDIQPASNSLRGKFLSSLLDIKTTIEARQQKQINPSSISLYVIGAMFATSIIPCNQSNDPFVDSSWLGFCAGHSREYARKIGKRADDPARAAPKAPNVLSTDKVVMAQDNQSDSITYDFGPKKYTKKLGHIIDDLKKEQILEFGWFFDSKSKSHGHSTTIRKIGDAGIEFFDCNLGIFRFASKKAFIGFMINYLYIQSFKVGCEPLSQFSLTILSEKNADVRTPAPVISPHYQLDFIEQARPYIDHTFNLITRDIFDSDDRHEALKKLQDTLLVRAQALRSNLQGTQFEHVIASINQEILRIEADQKNLSFFNVIKKSRTAKKIIFLKADLAKYAAFVKSKSELSSYDKAVLLSALMFANLAMKRGSFAATSKARIKEITLDLELDEGLINRYISEIKQYRQDADSYIASHPVDITEGIVPSTSPWVERVEEKKLMQEARLEDRGNQIKLVLNVPDNEFISIQPRDKDGYDVEIKGIPARTEQLRRWCIGKNASAILSDDKQSVHIHFPKSVMKEIYHLSEQIKKQMADAPAAAPADTSPHTPKIRK